MPGQVDEEIGKGGGGEEKGPADRSPPERRDEEEDGREVEQEAFVGREEEPVRGRREGRGREAKDVGCGFGEAEVEGVSEAGGVKEEDNGTGQGRRADPCRAPPRDLVALAGCKKRREAEGCALGPGGRGEKNARARAKGGASFGAEKDSVGGEKKPERRDRFGEVLSSIDEERRGEGEDEPRPPRVAIVRAEAPRRNAFEEDDDPSPDEEVHERCEKGRREARRPFEGNRREVEERQGRAELGVEATVGADLSAVVVSTELLGAGDGEPFAGCERKGDAVLDHTVGREEMARGQRRADEDERRESAEGRHASIPQPFHRFHNPIQFFQSCPLRGWWEVVESGATSKEETQEEGAVRGFVGTYRHTIDGKGRIVLPAAFRVAAGRRVVLSGGFERCLQGLPEKDFEGFVREVIERASPLAQETRKLDRYFHATAAVVEVDKQGRMLVPPHLRERLGVSADGEGSGEVFIVGAGRRFEVWNPKRWEEYFGAAEKELEAIADSLAQSSQAARPPLTAPPSSRARS